MRTNWGRRARADRPLPDYEQLVEAIIKQHKRYRGNETGAAGLSFRSLDGLDTALPSANSFSAYAVDIPAAK
jgi:hypothetical protein